MTPLDIEAIRREFPVLHREVRGKPLVYLDSAATSQKPRAMIERMNRIYSHEYARPEEGHAMSEEATASFEATRSRVARLINAKSAREIVFCRGATEALNLIAFAFGHGLLLPGDEVVVSEAEHHSNIVPWLLACQQSGARLRPAPLTQGADLDLERFAAMLSPRVKIVAMTHVSNITGAVFPVEEVVALAHARSIPVLVDGAQAVPHMPVDVRAIGCDFYAGSGHKMGGPSSVGFLYGAARRLEALPLADGGSTMAAHVDFDKVEAMPIPHKYEAGEPAFAEVEAWGAAIDYWNELGLDRIAAYEAELTDHAVRRLSQIERVRVLGSPARRLSVVSFVVEGMRASRVAEGLDRAGIAVRAGKLAAEPLLKALGVSEAVRASFMVYNTRAEADLLADTLAELVR